MLRGWLNDQREAGEVMWQIKKDLMYGTVNLKDKFIVDPSEMVRVWGGYEEFYIGEQGDTNTHQAWLLGIERIEKHCDKCGAKIEED